jgi:hypothetical protein
MFTQALFEDLPSSAGAPVEAKPDRVRRVRVLSPNRGQIELRPSDLESLLPEGHRARIVWGFVMGQDLTALYAGIKVVEGGAGRPAIAPEILYALGLFVPVPKLKAPREDKKNKPGNPPRGSASDGTEERAALAIGEPVSAQPAVDLHQRKPGDSPAVGDWRERMCTDEVKELYKERAAVAECVNAQARNRNLVQLPVRGLKKVKAVATLYALAHNLMRMISLAPEMGWRGTGTSKICPMAT